MLEEGRGGGGKEDRGMWVSDDEELDPTSSREKLDACATLAFFDKAEAEVEAWLMGGARGRSRTSVWGTAWL